MHSLERFAASKLAELDRTDRRRTPRTVGRDRTAPSLARDDRTLLSLSCNDVLGLGRHPAVIAAAIDATRRHGTGAGASPLVTGRTPPVAALETQLARLKGTERAIVFGSGTLASLGVIPALVSPGDLVLADTLSHSCLLAGARLSGAALHLFGHNDDGHLAELLATYRGRHARCLVVTETVFSMDGDRAPLRALADLARAHDAWLLTDDAHGLGVLGEGRGGVRQAGLDAADVPLQLGTLSKAAGSAGGYLCASDAVVSLLHSRARTYIYATGLGPAHAAAAAAALSIIESDPALVSRPLARARRFAAAAALPEPASHIVPVILGAERAALEAARGLEAAGFLVVAIRPPTVAPGTARLRLAFPAAIEAAEVDRLASLVTPLIRQREAG